MMTDVPEQLKDFRNFTYLVWKHLGLPEPTPVQYDIAEYLQNSPKRCIIEAFRGVGKSYITAAYVVHQLLLNPQLKFMVVSASKARADDFSTFTQRIIMELPICQHLVAKDGQRWSKIAFDVAPAKASGSPSVKSVGVTGQLTGSRADIIIADDVEVPNNSMT
uniref:phage terminase large subunit n=1 Tax=Shewanella sp. TaxID=50422 RepID=UPI0040476A38